MCFWAIGSAAAGYIINNLGTWEKPEHPNNIPQRTPNCLSKPPPLCFSCWLKYGAPSLVAKAATLSTPSLCFLLAACRLQCTDDILPIVHCHIQLYLGRLPLPWLRPDRAGCVSRGCTGLPAPVQRDTLPDRQVSHAVLCCVERWHWQTRTCTARTAARRADDPCCTVLHCDVLRC